MESEIKLSEKQSLLLLELVEDFKGGLLPQERIFNSDNFKQLIYNLLRSKKYEFSYDDYSALFDYLNLKYNESLTS